MTTGDDFSGSCSRRALIRSCSEWAGIRLDHISMVFQTEGFQLTVRQRKQHSLNTH